MTSLTKTSAMVRAEYECFKSRKWLYLESLSTTTSIASYPLDLGKPTMKSMETSSQIAWGIDKGWSNPLGAAELALQRWHISQLLTNR